MWFMYILTWIALILQTCIIVLCIAAGLYYLAELVEEYTVFTSKIIKYLIIVSTCAFVGFLLFEDIPFINIIAGLLGNAAYLLLLYDFPYCFLTSPGFIGSVCSMVVNHYFAFSYFTTVWHPFQEVLAYFTICLWLVPFAFFVSLSANENVLPTLSSAPPQQPTEGDADIVTNYFKKRGKKYGLLHLFKYAQDSVLPQRVKKHF